MKRILVFVFVAAFATPQVQVSGGNVNIQRWRLTNLHGL